MAHFDKLFDETKEQGKIRLKPLVKAKLQRTIQSGYDGIETELLETEESIEKARGVENYNLQGVVDAKMKIRRLQEIKEVVAEEYKFMFDTDIRR